MPQPDGLSKSVTACQSCLSCRCDGGPKLNVEATFPVHLDVDVTLKDGSTVHIRPVLPSDQEALQRFLAGLSTESRVFRFFSEVKDLATTARRFVEVDYRDRHGLVAWRGGEIVGHGFYALERPGTAEVALTVADALQGKGLGTILLGHLAAAAAAAGISVFEAEVMPENHRMLAVFRDSGFPISVSSWYGVIKVEFPTSLTEEARERFERREQLSAIAAIRRFFEPRSIAVIGASRHRGTIGGEVFHNLLALGSPARSIRSARIQWCSRWRPTLISGESRGRLIWPWWWCPRPTWSRWPGPARPRESKPWS
jgi:GNAT superfamily N-acetyltransferase